MSQQISTPASSPILDSAANGTWDKLRFHVECSQGFWVAYVFTPNVASAREFESRMESLLAGQEQTQRILQPATSQELRNLITEVFSPESSQAHCLWIEAVHFDMNHADSSPGPWMEAWDWLMLRLNERRERLRRHLPGGVIFVASPIMKSRFRDAAPDLWSIHSMVLELNPGQQDVIVRRSKGVLRSTVILPPSPASQLVFSELRRLTGKTDAESKKARAIALIRIAEASLAEGKIEESLCSAGESLKLLEKNTPEFAKASAMLSFAEATDGDFSAAFEHISQAITLTPDGEGLEKLHWLIHRGDLEQETSGLIAASKTYKQAIPLARHLTEGRPLSIALNRLGDVLLELHDFDGAEELYRESLDFRLAARTKAPSCEELREIGRNFARLGNVLMEKQVVDQAEAAFRESLSFFHQANDVGGGTPQALSDLAYVLSQFSEVLRLQGNIEHAEAVASDSLAYSQQATFIDDEKEDRASRRSVHFSRKTDNWSFSNDERLAFEKELLKQHRDDLVDS